MLTKDDLLKLTGAGDHVDHATMFEVERFIYAEARMFDDERFRDWYDILAEDLVYWVPIRENHFRKHRKPELASNRVAMFDETKETFEMRLGRLESGMCWTEDPATRHVYSVTNLEAFHTDDDNVIEVHSVFTLYRNRFERDDNTLMGRRRDLIRRTEGGFELLGRLALLQQSTLLAKNLNVFF